jgi:hypothetical protein
VHRRNRTMRLLLRAAHTYSHNWSRITSISRGQPPRLLPAADSARSLAQPSRKSPPGFLSRQRLARNDGQLPDPHLKPARNAGIICILLLKNREKFRKVTRQRQRKAFPMFTGRSLALPRRGKLLRYHPESEANLPFTSSRYHVPGGLHVTFQSPITRTGFSVRMRQDAFAPI